MMFQVSPSYPIARKAGNAQGRGKFLRSSGVIQNFPT